MEWILEDLRNTPSTLANVNQSLYFDKRITLKLLNKLSNLEYVFISVDYHSLHFSSQGIRDKWSYFANGVRYKNEDYFLERLSPSLFAYTPKVILSFLKRDLKNIFIYNNKAVDFPVEQGVAPLDTLYHGFIGYSGADETSFRQSRYKGKADIFNDKVEKNNLKEENLKDLEEFIQILKNRNISPVLFSPPTYSEYNLYLDSIQLKYNIEEFRRISQKYDVLYWNFMDSKLFSQELFYDGDHLNKKGALKFSKILNDSIQALE